ncbi:MAG: D-glycero-beta-D-manno-heptose-7-phosphate kinase [Verrucomicrobiota bacterium]|jgi:D-beta-D-heptose 7-phosphate kinase/D-beta-D-heptose 1-phosphate adenosyltransferase|nr:D-glycero-beta-D-manno-heptose-7-phosphate kinase [Verrucomicrobiota bacterium]MDP7014030.1 D-glycero-beta-D-manno-heptose-7-phosphate kinase [Verrucomicrobiota bacterium]
MAEQKTVSRRRARNILNTAAKRTVLVTGDAMLDQFLWGDVSRISPEAPVPVVEFQRESFMPGGAANVARNLTALNCPAKMHSVVGRDDAAKKLRTLLNAENVDCTKLVTDPSRQTSCKTRIIAQRQQVVRVDRESRADLEPRLAKRLLRSIDNDLAKSEAVVIGDYGKGVVTQEFLDELKALGQRHGAWLSLDPKPVHSLDLRGLSLITPNRKEAFELADIGDTTYNANPIKDRNLMRAAKQLLGELDLKVLLITLGELGMLVCQPGRKPFHIPTLAREVFDVSGAGDTVIGSFTLAIAAGATPIEAAIVANHAAGIVVGKLGTATVTPRELLASF